MGIELVLQLLLSGVLFVLVVLIVQLTISGNRYKLNQSELAEIGRLEDTPTVSLCIPARNETNVLADCLTAAIASDYPKLEILVLDDCSQDKTSQVIKSFAHDGVRFIQGDTPSDGWLGKNNAYSALASQAKGSYIVFMSVDTLVEPNSISQLVAYMQLKKLSMLSVLPQRYDSFRRSVLFAPLRYFWQFVLPLRFNTPVATSIWAITDDALAEMGGFDTYKDKVDVENQFARHFQSTDEYRFIVANSLLRIQYAKKWQSQVDTAIRLWYPLLGKSFSKAFLAITAHFILFILPVLTLVGALVSLEDSHGYIRASWALALIVLLLASYIYFEYFRHIKRIATLSDIAATILSFFLLPLLALQEICLIVTSFVQYKRGKVDWKGRNICFPVTKRY